MTITNKSTNKVDKYEFKVTNNSGAYTTEVINNGMPQGSFATAVDPLQPNICNKLNNYLTSGVNVKPNIVSPMTADKKWDGVWYSTNNVPYHHPDYGTYISNIYQDNIVWGSQLAAVQISHQSSQALVVLPVVTMAASIIVLCNALVIAVFGGLTGAATAIAIMLLGAAILDEKGDIWVWGSYYQESINLWFIHIGLGPGYFKIRIGSAMGLYR